MANATAVVKKGVVGNHIPHRFKQSTETLASETTFYKHAMIGVDSSGYYCKADDTQAWIMGGVVFGDQGNPVIPAGTAGDATLALEVEKPTFIELAISGVAVTDVGKTVYALDDQTGTLDFSATTYANVIGSVEHYLASGIALVRVAYDGIAANVRLNAAKRLAASGAQTLAFSDVGKTIFCANTTTLTVTLMAVPQAGRSITIVKDHASDANAITVAGAGSDSIEGGANFATLDAAYDVTEIVSNGTRWVHKARDIA